MTERHLIANPVEASVLIRDRTEVWSVTDDGPGESVGFVEKGTYVADTFARVSGGGFAREYYVIERKPGVRVSVLASACELQPE